MSRPSRHCSSPDIHAECRTFFITTAAWGHRRLFQTGRMAKLLLDVLYHYRDKAPFRLHEFVVMPDHLHILITIGPELTVERAVQFIKGGFSFRAARELQFRGEIWQRGFSEVRILTDGDYRTRCAYIRDNPVRARLVPLPEDWEYSSASASRATDPSPFAAAEAAESILSSRHD